MRLGLGFEIEIIQKKLIGFEVEKKGESLKSSSFKGERKGCGN